MDMEDKAIYWQNIRAFKRKVDYFYNNLPERKDTVKTPSKDEKETETTT